MIIEKAKNIQKKQKFKQSVNMESEDSPKYPITITFLEDGEKLTLNNEKQLAVTLEWFNSEDKEEKTITKDSKGRNLEILVEKLEIKIFRLKNNKKYE